MKTFRMIGAVVMAAVLCGLSACTPDDMGGDMQDNDRPVYTPPTGEDIVKTRIAGKILYFAGGHATLDQFLAKRFENITTSYDDDVRLVLLNESKAAEILADEALYGKIRSYWLQNKAIGFVKPGEKAIALLRSLKSAGSQLNAASSISDESKQYMNDLNIFITKADNKSMLYRSFDNERIHYSNNIITDSKDGSIESKTGEKRVTIVPNDHIWGLVAEAFCDWANKQQEEKSPLMANMAMTRSDDALTPTSQEITHAELVTLNSDFMHEFDDHYPVRLASLSTTATLTINVLSGFNDNSEDMCDVYDVVVTSEVPAQETFSFEDCIFNKSGLYHYKATGFGYLGPTATYHLVNEDGSAIAKPTSVHEMSPIVEGGTIKTTHTPGKLTFGGEISTKGGGAVAFSMKYSLPSTSTTISTADNPFDFSKEGSTGAKWAYYKGAYDYYRHTWGFNGKYLDTAPEITRTYASYTQALTFKVDDARDLGTQNLALYLDVDYSFYAEACSPWKVNQHTQQVDIAATSVVLDPVSRYFEKYTPSQYYSDSYADSSAWSNLQAMLQGNVNYKHFCNDDLRVCARLEAELIPNAEAVWSEAIKSLVAQYNGNPVGHEYIVGLADSNGAWLKSGLHIKDGVWRFVEDVEALRNEINAAE